ncbi:hypothetical protein BECAL_00572, partial [Bellilinea caldifistulae]
MGEINFVNVIASERKRAWQSERGGGRSPP